MLLPWWCVRCCFVLSVLAVLVRASNYSCPTWFYYSNTTQRCECGPEIIYGIECDQQTATVQIGNGFCATYSGNDDLFFLCVCPLTYQFNRTNRLLSELPTDPDQLNDMMCGPYNRKGLCCARCLSGYGPGVYTLDRKCSNCSKMSIFSAICLYVLVDLIPITVLFVLVITFRLNLTSGPFLGYVLFCQGLFFMVEFDLVLWYDGINLQSSTLFKSVVNVLYMMVDCWNLSLLKPVIPPFCISQKLTGIHIHFLNTASAFYLVFLAVFLLVVIDLHARSNKVHTLLKPFTIVLKKAKMKNISSDSVIRAFATFLQLSSTRQLMLFNDLLETSSITSNKPNYTVAVKTVLYNDATIEYHSHKHIILLAVSLVQCILFVFLPSFLLFIYPTRAYRSISQYMGNRKKLAITTFVETLNHIYKDGLNSTRDYRWLAGFSLLGIPFVALCFNTLDLKKYNWFLFCFHYFSFLAIVVSFTRPCKSIITNISLSFYCILIGMCGLVGFLCHRDNSLSNEALQLMIFLIVSSSQVPMAIWGLYNLFLSYKILHRLSHMIQQLSHMIQQLSHSARFKVYSLLK